MDGLLGHTEKTVSHSFDLLKSTNFGEKKEEWGAFSYGSTFFCLYHAFLSMPPCFAVPAQILCLQAAQKPMDHLLGPTVFPLQANTLFIFLYSSNTEIFFPQLIHLNSSSHQNVGIYLQLEFCSPKWIVMLSRTTVWSGVYSQELWSGSSSDNCEIHRISLLICHPLGCNDHPHISSQTALEHIPKFLTRITENIHLRNITSLLLSYSCCFSLWPWLMPRVAAVPPESQMCIITIPVLGPQLWLTLCHPMDCSPPGSSVRGIFQARILEWFAISFIGWASPKSPWLLLLPKSVWWLVDPMFLARVVCQCLGYNCCCHAASCICQLHPFDPFGACTNIASATTKIADAAGCDTACPALLRCIALSSRHCPRDWDRKSVV